MSRLAHKLTSSRSSFLDKVEARVKLSVTPSFLSQIPQKFLALLDYA